MWSLVFLACVHILNCKNALGLKTMETVVTFSDPKIGDERLKKIKLPDINLHHSDESNLKDVRKTAPAEMRKNFEHLLDLMDINGDGDLEKQELIDWTYALLKKKDHDYGKADFDKGDANKDGYLTLAEIVKHKLGRPLEDLEALSQSEDDRRSARDKQKFADLLKDFSYYDLNQDKKLNEEEYHLMQHPWEFDYSAEKLVKDKLNVFDFDNDGTITLEEFAVEAHDYPVGSEAYLRMKEKFDQWDEDQDGKLSDEEIIWGWSFPDRLKEAEKIVDKVWDKTDVNKDGKIQKREALPFYILWSRHELTHYGQYLGAQKPNLKGPIKEDDFVAKPIVPDRGSRNEL